MASKKILIVLILGIILCVGGTFSLIFNYIVNADIYAGKPISVPNIINIVFIIIGFIIIIMGIILKKKS
ncbi:MAG: hypothetical protein JXA99_09585 [Candidatus Lokiarchaeota archaeon]|nr:hypothetical protein [Candidatus Lokiarchaeota archaeon]